MRQTLKRRSSLRRWLGSAASASFALYVTVGILLGFVKDIRSGHGFDYRMNAMGVRFNAITGLVTFVIILLLIVLASVVNFWRRKRGKGSVSDTPGAGA
jgi:ABC-type microcin C transport system permease subunit YejB